MAALASDPLPPRHAKLVELLLLWENKAAGRLMPHRRELSPFDLKDWLGNLSLVDVIEGGRDFRYRVHGTNLARLVRREMTGRLVSEGPPPYRDTIITEYRAAFEHKAPFRCAHVQRGDRIGDGWEKLILPLAGDSGGADYLLSGMYPSPRLYTPATDPQRC